MKKKTTIIVTVILLVLIAGCLYVGQLVMCALNVRMGQKAFREGDLARSEAYYLKAIDIKPESAFARYHYYTDFLKKQERYEDGIPHLQVIVKVEPKYWFGYYMLGTAYHMIGQYDEALPYLQTAGEKLEGQNAADALHRMAQIMRKRNEHEKAIELLVKAKEVKPLLPRVILLLGGEYSVIGKNVEGYELYKEYIRDHIENYKEPTHEEILIYTTFVSEYLINDLVKQEINNLLFEMNFKNVNPLLYKFNDLVQAMRENESNQQQLLDEIRAAVLEMQQEQRAVYEEAHMLDLLNELDKQV